MAAQGYASWREAVEGVEARTEVRSVNQRALLGHRMPVVAPAQPGVIFQDLWDWYTSSRLTMKRAAKCLGVNVVTLSGYLRRVNPMPTRVARRLQTLIDRPELWKSLPKRKLVLSWSRRR